MRFIFAILSLASSLARAKTESPANPFAALLAKQKVIRIGVDWGPGMGHQSAAASVYRQLRVLGYAGEIEIIYDDQAPGMSVKMSAVFKEFDPNGPPEQARAREKLRFIPEDTFSKRSFLEQETGLAFMGADDQGRRAGDLRSRVLITLQPMNWPAPATISFARPRRGVRSIDVSHLNSLPFVYDMAAVPSLLTDEGIPPSYSVSRDRRRSLRLIEARRDRFDIAPYYGHGLYKNVGQLQLYVSAIREALRRHPDRFDKPVVVPILMELSVLQRREISRVINSLRGSGRFVALDRTDLERELDYLRRFQILIVEVGALPRDVFDYWLTHASIPPVVGGRNSINLLAQVGRPYLTSNDRESYHFFGGRIDGDTIPTFNEEMQFLHTVRKASLDVLGGSAEVQILADFFDRTRLPDSPLNQFFAHQRISPGLYGDKVSQSLVTYLRAVQAGARASLAKDKTYRRKLTSSVPSCGPDLEESAE